jgi:hypothetical protein
MLFFILRCDSRPLTVEEFSRINLMHDYPIVILW